MSAAAFILRLGATGTAEVKGAVDSVRGALDEVKEGAQRMGDTASAVFDKLRNLAAMVGLGLTVKEFIQAADAMALMQARLKLVTDGVAGFAAAQADVYRIAQANNVGLQETSALYTRLATPIKELGGSAKQTAQIVESFALSLRVGGASTQEASAATLQFAQAMGSGRLQGDEFRSMAEASPRFMRALADGMGVPIGALKEMGQEGALTADVVGNALIKSLAQLRDEGAKLPDTVGGAMTRLKNDVLVAVDEINKESGLTIGVAELIETVKRELLPVIRDELGAAFKSVGEFLRDHREKIGDVWQTAKGLIGDVWELAKAAASVLGFLADWALRTDQVKTRLEVLRLLVAGFKDGVVIIGAAFAHVGSQILQFLVSPLTLVGKLAAAIVGVFDKELAASIRSMVASVDEFARAGEEYAAGVVQQFADGNSSVQQLGRSMDKSAKDAVQLKQALAGGAISAADSARETKTMARAAEEASASHNKLESALKNGSEESKRLADETGKVIAELRKHIFVQQQEEAQGNKLSAAQQKALDITIKLRDGVIGRTAAERTLIGELLEQMLVNDEANDQRRQEAKLQEELLKWRQKEAEAAQKRADELEGQLAKQLEENNALRYTAAELAALSAARLGDEIEMARQVVARDELLGYCNAETSAHKRTLEALLALQQARDDNVTLKAAKDAADAWKKTADEVESGLTSALMRAFESGKGFFDALRSTLVNSFKTLVLQPIVKFVMAPVAALVGGVYSSLAAAATGGTGAGVGGSSLLEGASYYNAARALNGGFGQAGEALAGAWNYAGAYSGSTYGTAFGSQQSAMLAAQDAGMGTAAGGTAGSLGTWAGAALGAIGGHYAGRAISGGYSTGGSGNANVNAGTAIGTAIGAFFGMPGVGGLLGGAVGGLINRAFGRKSPNVTGEGVQGTLAGGGFSGEQYRDWFQEGGWFKSDRRWTDLSKVDDQVQTALAVGAAGVLAQAKTYANALGLPVEALDKVSTSVRIAFGSNEADNLKAIAAAFEQYGEQLSGQYAQAVQDAARSGESTTATLQRLGGSLLSVNGVFESLGLHLANVSVAGGAAASELLDLSGGLDKFLAKTQAYIGAYFTEGEQSGLAARAILEQLSGAGLDFSGAAGRQDLRTLLESLDINRDDQRRQIAALLDVASDYAKVADYMKSAGLTLGEVAALAPTSAVVGDGSKTIDPVTDRSIALQAEGNGLLDGISKRLDAMQSSLESGLAAVAQASADTAKVLQRWDTPDGMSVVVVP